MKKMKQKNKVREEEEDFLMYQDANIKDESLGVAEDEDMEKEYERRQMGE